MIIPIIYMFKEWRKKKMKNFFIQNNVGNAKYVVSFHDGKKTHRDGSPFYDVAIFRNKKHLAHFENKLKSEGYTTK